MAGGLLQLIANGVQDIIFTQDPQITFFKTVYRRYTNFTIDQQLLSFSGICNFGKKNECVLRKNGDLLGKLYLCIKLPSILLRYKKTNIDRMFDILKDFDIKIDTRDDVLFDASILINPTNSEEILSFGDLIINLEKKIRERKTIDEISEFLCNGVNKINEINKNICLKQNTKNKINKLIEEFKNAIPLIIDNVTKISNNIANQRILILQQINNAIHNNLNYLNNLEASSRLKLTNFSNNKLTNYINLSIKKLLDYSENGLIDGEIGVQQTIGEILELKNNIINCVPLESEYVNVTNNEINQLVDNIPNIFSCADSDLFNTPISPIKIIIDKLMEFNERLSQIEHKLTVIEDLIYIKICNLQDIISKNNQTLIDLQSLFDDTNNDDLYSQIAKILLNKNPLLGKIYNHLEGMINNFSNPDQNEPVDTLQTIVRRIQCNIRKYIFRKITVDNLIFRTNENNKYLVPEIDLDFFEAHLFQTKPEPYTKENENETKIVIGETYINVFYEEKIIFNESNVGTIIKVGEQNNLIKCPNYDNNNEDHNKLFNILEQTKENLEQLFKTNDNIRYLDESNIIGLFDANTWNIPKFYYIRFGTDFVQFLDNNTFDIILTVNKYGFEKGPAFNDKLILEYIRKNIYNPLPYFSDKNTNESNILFLDNLRSILNPNKIFDSNKSLQKIVISELDKLYLNKINYINLDAFISIEHFLKTDIDKNFSVKQSEYSEIIIESLKYNFHLHNNIFRTVCAKDLVIDNRYVVGGGNPIKSNFSQIGNFIGNLEFDKLINDKYNKICSVLFFSSWGNFYKILSDIGNLSEILKINGVDRLVHSTGVAKIKNYNIMFNYVEYIFRTLIENISQFYSWLSNKYIGQLNEEKWTSINLQKDVYYVNILYIEYNDMIKNRIIKNLENISDQYNKPKITNKPDPPKLVSFKFWNGEIFEKEISFCKEIVPNKTYECYELVELNENSLPFINMIINNVKQAIEEIHLDLDFVLKNIINNDLQNMESDLETINNEDGSIKHFLFTHYTNSQNFTGLTNSRLNVSNIVKYYVEKIQEIKNNDAYYTFDNVDYNTDFDGELHTVLNMLVNVCIGTTNEFDKYNKTKQFNILKESINFKKNGYINTTTPEQIINLLLHKKPIKLKIATIEPIELELDKPDKKCADYSYKLYAEIYESLQKEIETKCTIPYLIDSEIMHDKQFSWFYKTILDEWVTKKHIGKVIFDSLGKIKSKLKKDTNFKYDVVNRNVDEISPNIFMFNENKLLKANELTRRLLNRYIGYPYSNVSVDNINDILKNEYQQSCFVEDKLMSGVLKIYEIQRKWIPCLKKVVGANVNSNLSRKEILKKIFDNLLDNKFAINLRQKNYDQLSETEKMIIQCVDQFIEHGYVQIFPNDNTLFCEILTYVIGLELNKYTTHEDFFGYKTKSFKQNKTTDGNLIYHNNKKENSLHNSIDPYNVIRNDNKKSYYYANKSQFTLDLSSIYGISTVFPVLYEDGEDKFPFSFLNYESNTFTDSGQETFIEMDFGRLLRYNKVDNKYYYYSGEQAEQIDIQDSDEHGNLLYLTETGRVVIKKNGNYYYCDTNELINGDVNIMEKYNILNREWILTENRNKLYFYFDETEFEEKYVYEKDGEYFNEDGSCFKNNIQIRPYYIKDTNIRCYKNDIEEQIYEIFVEYEKINENGSLLWSSGNINLLFNYQNNIVRLNSDGEFKLNGFEFDGDINKLYPIKASSTSFAKKLILKRYGIGHSIVIYTNIVEISNDETFIFPVEMLFEPEFEKPIRLLKRCIIDRSVNVELVSDGLLRILKNTNVDSKISVVKDLSGRRVFKDLTNCEIVLEYPAEFTVESTGDKYNILPLYNGLIFDGEPSLIPSGEIIKSDVFDAGDADGIAITFNQANINYMEGFSQVFNKFVGGTDKLSITKNYLQYIINLSDDVLINSGKLFDNVEQNKDNILNLIMDENRRIEQQIGELRGVYGLIKKTLDGSNFANFAWTRRLGHFIIDEIKIVIGGQVMDTHYGAWLNVWYELSKNPSQIRGYNKMIGDIPELYEYNNKRKPEYLMYVPLYFWFCEDSGLYLPLVGLQYSEVTLHVKFRSLEEIAHWENDTEFVTMVQNNNSDIITIEQKPQLQCDVLAQYVYLEEKERKIFSRSRHEYLIHQLQYNGGMPVTKSCAHSNIYFNSPCKEFIWNVQFNKFINGSLENGERQWYNYATKKYKYDSDKHLVKQKKIIKKEKKKLIVDNNVLYEYTEFFNKNTTKYEKSPIGGISEGKIYIMGDSRISSQRKNTYFDTNYLSYVQSYQNHSHTPLTGINLYSFAIHPEHLQPSGSINMTKIDDCKLSVHIHSSILNGSSILDKEDWGKLAVYARNYNILRILSGMAGLAFSF